CATDDNSGWFYRFHVW
nr:immunoglobulin heavy chain junction region [Macaca mulatta]MOV38975.1 immunoglobulin heavy chain junction region [Macaca mulatta]MOV39548.1 immunoglobulin heavy chain junction region [Macaca mulatta]MOV39753.1 immunoglobulin heavy chain junction region [Macaca mulatta]MOV41475.1 immunoglobulin heavy chain junction region [Macaca mulatta]